MVDVGGYVIILLKTKDCKIRLYGSFADKEDLKIDDEILDVNGHTLSNSTREQAIEHINQCIKSRVICLRCRHTPQRPGVIFKLWISDIILQLLIDVTLAEADLQMKSGVNQWIPNIFFANPYVVRYPQVNRSISPPVNSTKSQSRAFGDSYLNGNSFDYSSFTDIRQDKAVPVNSNIPSSNTPAGSISSGSSSSYPSINQQYPPYPYPSGGYYYPAPSYLPPTQYWPPSQTFNIPNTYDYGLYPPSNSTSGQVNSKNQFIVQPNMCSNSIQVVRSNDVDLRTSFKYDSNQTYACILMLYGLNEYNRLAVSLEAKQNQQQPTNSTSVDDWLQKNIKMYSVQGSNITLIDTTSNFGTNSSGLVLTKSNIVILSLDVDRAVDFLLDISTYQSESC